MEFVHAVRPDTGEPTGVRLPRHEAIARGVWCRSTNVFVLNARGEVLCHKRDLAKERLPGVWMTHLGGHVGVGETYETNARKELAEEAGVLLRPEELLAWRTTRMDGARLWVREFVAVVDAPADALVPQPGEVDAFAWMAPDAVIRASAEYPEEWCAGTHDFAVEYQCLRAAVTAASPGGAHAALGVWHPAGA
jgi:isopentenyldiphosphate isomerase